MKKQLRIILLSIIFILIFTVNCLASTISGKATTSELNILKAETTDTSEINPYEVIKFPSYTSTDEIKITVDDSKIGTYSFFYQIIEMTESQYTAISNARNNYNNDVAAVNEQLKNEQAELKAEKEKCDELRAAYEKAYAADPASQETLAAKKKYEDAAKLYNEHVSQAQAYLTEQKTILDAKLKELYALYPKYDDTKWIASSTNTASYKKTVSQKTYLALWVKLETADQNLYAVADYAVNPTTNPPANTNTNTNSNTNTQLPTSKNNTTSNDTTRAPTSLPAAGNPLVIFSVLAFISVIGGYFYIRANTIDK